MTELEKIYDDLSKRYESRTGMNTEKDIYDYKEIIKDYKQSTGDDFRINAGNYDQTLWLFKKIADLKAQLTWLKGK